MKFVLFRPAVIVSLLLMLLPALVVVVCDRPLAFGASASVDCGDAQRSRRGYA